MKIKLNALGVKVVHGGDQVLKGASEAVDAPNGDEVEFAPRGGFQESIEGRASIATLGSADTIVSISGDHIPATKSGDTLKFMKLVVSGLVGGGYSDVQGGFGLVHR